MSFRRHRFAHRLGFAVIAAFGWLVGLTAQTTPNEEVFFFQASGGQSKTDDGGTIIWEEANATWRWWYQNTWQANVSPDGKKVAYVVFNGPGAPSLTVIPSIYVANINGSSPQLFASGAYLPKWSPDGEQIAFLAYLNQRDPGIWVKPSAGGDERLVTSTQPRPNIIRNIERSNANVGGAMSWSPDSRKIAFCATTSITITNNQVYNDYYDSNTSDQTTANSVLTVDVETGEVETLLAGSYEWFPGGSVDGSAGGLSCVGVTRQTVSYSWVEWHPSENNVAVAERLTKSAFPPRSYTQPCDGLNQSLDTTRVVIHDLASGLSSVVSSDSRDTLVGSGTEHIDYPLSWSPDGTELAWVRTTGANFGTYRSSGSGPGTKVNGFLPLQLQWTQLLKSGIRLKLNLEPFEGFQQDEAVVAEIEVQSFEDSPVTVSFQGDPLQTDSPGILEVNFDQAIEPFELTPEEPVRKFTAVVVPRELGTGEISTTVAATTSLGNEVLTETEQITVPGLEVNLRALPLVGGDPIVNMELDEEGSLFDENETPIDARVEVAITNRSNQPIDVLLQGVDPRARDRSALVGRIETYGTFPMDLNTLAAGGTVTREIDVEIHEDGRYEFAAVATGVYSGTGEQFNATARGAPIAVGEPYPVELEFELVDSSVITGQNNGAYLVKPGGEIQVIAAVSNLTSNATLYFTGIDSEKKGNVLGARLTSTAGREVDPPMLHDHEVSAGGAAILSGRILTAPDGAPAGTVTFQFPFDVQLIDDATQEVTELSNEDILVKTNFEGWLGDEMAVRIIQDFSREEVPLEFGVFTVPGYYSYGVMVGIGQWTHDTFDAIGGIGRVAGRVSADPSLLADALGDASAAVWYGAELLAQTWEEMTPEEKEEFIERVTTETSRRLSLFLVAGKAPVDPEEADAVRTYVSDAIYPLFNSMEQAYADNDPRAISQLWGQVSGNVAMEVATSFLPTQFDEYVKGAELVKLRKSQDLGEALTDQEARLRAIPSGKIDKDTALKAFGVGGEDIDIIQRVFKVLKVKGYARERSPISYRLINELGEAVWKPELMKPKGISQLDIDMMQNPNLTLPSNTGGDEVGLLGITGIFWPDNDFVIRNRLSAKGYTEEGIQAGLARAAKRREEYAEYAPKFKEWQEDGFSVAKNYKDNGVPDPDPLKTDQREFNVNIIDSGIGTQEIIIPKMANIDGDLRYISGDIDWIHFSNLDGSPLSPKKASLLYGVLVRCCGVQHPETVSWIRDGQTVFKTKAGQIGEYFSGQKALFELSGDGPRAVRVRADLTRFVQNGRGHWVFFENGIKSKLKAAELDFENAVAKLTKLYPYSFFGGKPFLWSLEDDDPTILGEPWEFTDSVGDAHLLRKTSDGIEEFDGTDWVPFNSPASSAPLAYAVMGASSDPVAPLPLTPTSEFTEATAAGIDQLPVLDVPGAFPAETAGLVAGWFEVGQQVVIAPGELTQEIRTVVGTAPFTVDRPLAYAHPKFTVIAMIPANMEVTAASDIPSELLFEQSDETSVYQTWESAPGRMYVFEVSDGAEPPSWTPLTQVGAGDTSIDFEFDLASFDSEAEYRLRDVGMAPPEQGIDAMVIDRSEGTLTLQWESLSGETYLIDISDSLEVGGWSTVLPLHTASGSSTSVTLPFDAAKEFFRVRKFGDPMLDGSTLPLALEENSATGETHVSWISEDGKQYLLETANPTLAEAWKTFGGPVAGSGGLVSVTIPAPSGAPDQVYRIREVE